MSLKEWVVQEGQYGIYQELDFDVNDTNQNAACIHVEGPSDYRIERATNFDNKAFLRLTVQIPADIMDKLAKQWCKTRKIRKAIGGPIEKEIASPDCEHDGNMPFQNREGQPKIEVAPNVNSKKRDHARAEEFPAEHGESNLNSMFEALSDDKKQTEDPEETSNLIIKLREGILFAAVSHTDILIVSRGPLNSFQTRQPTHKEMILIVLLLTQKMLIRTGKDEDCYELFEGKHYQFLKWSSEDV